MQTIPPLLPEPAPLPRVDPMDKDLARLDSEAMRHDAPERIPGYFPLQGQLHPPSGNAARAAFSQFRSHLPPNPTETIMITQDNLVLVMNQLLADEFSTISQYTVHAEMCANWGYDKLHRAIQTRVLDEIHHAKWLIRRLLSLGATPALTILQQLSIGSTVADMVFKDQQSELSAVHAYNAAVSLALETHDQVTADLLGKILHTEEEHADWAETQQSQILQMGLENYLTLQSSGATGAAPA